MALTGKERRFLRGLGHHLTPVVMVGKDGISTALVAAANQALDDHELIKIKVGEGSPMDRYEATDALAEATGSEVAQVLGRTALLYRPDPKNPRIELPRPGKPGSAGEGKASRKNDEGDGIGVTHSPAPITRKQKAHMPHRSSKNALR